MSRHFIFIQDLLKDALKGLAANKRRTFVTALGIIIGVAAVIIIVAIGAGAQNLIVSQLDTFGSDLVGVLPGASEEDGPPATVMGINITTLTYEDALAIADPANVPHVAAVDAHYRGRETVSWRGQLYTTDVVGVTADYQAVHGGRVDSGRFFNSREESSLARVAVLGFTAAEELFGQTEPLGRRIKIKNQQFTVIGVMEERGVVAFQDYDDQILVPIRSMQRLIAGVNHINLIRAKIDDPIYAEQTIRDIEMTLREQHGIRDSSGNSDDFTVRASAQALDVLGTVTDSLRYFLTAMAALSLLVGGIGIMNIMLTRVSKRTREIGLRKAVGATDRDITLQFLAESAAMTLAGGIIGIVIGELIAFIISYTANSMGYNWGYHFSIWSIIISAGVAIMVGLIFGMYPAKKASGLDPIEALRYE